MACPETAREIEGQESLGKELQGIMIGFLARGAHITTVRRAALTLDRRLAEEIYQAKTGRCYLYSSLVPEAQKVSGEKRTD